MTKASLIPTIFMTAACALPALTLAICYAMFDGHTSNSGGGGGSGPPAISTLGDKGSAHTIFAMGFVLTAIAICVAVECRRRMLTTDAGVSKQGAIAMSCIAWIAAPFICMMGVFADSGPHGDLHFTGAGVGMGGLCVYALAHGITCIRHRAHVDTFAGKAARINFYVFSTFVAGLLAPLLFGIWFVGDKKTSYNEWAGVTALLFGLLPFIYFFEAHRRGSNKTENLLHAQIV
jgi:hypothetical protein